MVFSFLLYLHKPQQTLKRYFYSCSAFSILKNRNWGAILIPMISAPVRTDSHGNGIFISAAPKDVWTKPSSDSVHQYPQQLETKGTEKIFSFLSYLWQIGLASTKLVLWSYTVRNSKALRWYFHSCSICTSHNRPWRGIFILAISSECWEQELRGHFNSCDICTN